MTKAQAAAVLQQMAADVIRQLPEDADVTAVQVDVIQRENERAPAWPPRKDEEQEWS
jgi:hypothetical protein